MCCLFTCCGWMIDLIQRLWTFTMSCCISSAVCCALLTASMSGIALGYNYSLAEYIDLKETNVSVYLKRGIFDDEIGDDMDWRRSGHQPVAGHIGENNLRTGASEDESSSIRSGRRLDDSIFESDDRNKFEGSLMKLTAKPLVPSPNPETETTVDTDQILSKYSMGSLDQMKALQSLINMKKYVDPRRNMGREQIKTSPEYVIDDRYLPQVSVNPNDLAPGRRYMPVPPLPKVHNVPSNSARLAVPEERINERGKWSLPNVPLEAFTRDRYGDYYARPTYPMPVTIRAGPVRPSRPKPPARPRPTLTAPSSPIIGRQEPNHPKSIDEEMDTFKDKLLFDAPSFKEDNFMKNMPGQGQQDDYADAVKGVPLRKKRHNVVSAIPKSIKVNKSFLYDRTTKEPNNLDEVSHTLGQTVTDVLPKEGTRLFSSTSAKLVTSEVALNDHKGNTKYPSTSTSTILLSNIVTKLLKTTLT